MAARALPAPTRIATARARGESAAGGIDVHDHGRCRRRPTAREAPLDAGRSSRSFTSIWICQTPPGRELTSAGNRRRALQLVGQRRRSAPRRSARAAPHARTRRADRESSDDLVATRELVDAFKVATCVVGDHGATSGSRRRADASMHPRRRLSASLFRAIPSSQAATEPRCGRYPRAAVSAPAANTSAERSAASSLLPVRAGARRDRPAADDRR